MSGSDSSSVAYQQIVWSPAATIPEGGGIPLQFPLDPRRFAAPNGRSGDLLVIQLKSHHHETETRKAALRSLGLTGVRSSSLRSSFDETVYGQIRTVRDLVAVAQLNALVYKSASTVAQDMTDFERVEYGTNTRPGGRVKSSQGDYFSFESDRKGVLLEWSTSLGVVEALARFGNAFPRARPLKAESASIVALNASGLVGGEELPDVDLGSDHPLDPSSTFVDMPTGEAINVIHNQADHLVATRLGFRGLNFTWHRPYTRFVDIHVDRAEVGIYTRDYSLLPGIGAYARSTGADGFFDAVPITAQIREHGNVRHVRI